MKKFLLTVILSLLVLTGCQQPTIDYNGISDIDPSRPEVELEQETIQDEQQEIVEEEIEIEDDSEQEAEDEHKIIIDTYRTYFEEYKADLKSRKEAFKEVKGVEEHKYQFENFKDERNETIIAELDYDLYSCSSLEEYYRTNGSDTTRNGASYFAVAAAYASYVESIKKDLAKVESLWNEINSLIEEVDNTLIELELFTVEELIEKNNELLTKISNLVVIDFQALADKYDATRINTEIAQKYF